MHTSGKVAAWLVTIAILVGVYFTVRTFRVRDAWMKVAQDNERKIKENDEEIAKLTKTMEDKRMLLARTMIGWDREWSGVPLTGNPATGISLQIGTSRGIQQNQVLYVFIPNAEGTASTYLGDFIVNKAGDNSVEARANSRRRAADDNKVQSPAARVRTLIPSHFLARLGALDQQLLAVEATVESNKFELARQGILSGQSDKLIESRMAEINGNPQLADAPLPAVDIKGLLTALVEEEESRNAALIEADRLMRALKKTRDEFAKIRGENADRVLSLPQPDAADRTVGAAGQ
jgi:hypothetical protein